eukprot:33134_1
MDLLSQIQEYLNSLAHCFANSLEDLQVKTPPVSVDQARNIIELDSLPLPKDCKAKATQLFKLALEADALIGCLPASFETEAEQITEIQKLTEENDAAGRRLEAARKEAGKSQFQIASLLEDLSDAQFRAHDIRSR